MHFQNSRLRRAVSDLTMDKMILKRGAAGKIVSPSRRREAVDHVRAVLRVFERRACRAIGQPRSTQRRPLCTPDDEAVLAV